MKVCQILTLIFLTGVLSASELTLVNAGGSDHTDAGGNVWSGDTSTRFSGCTAFTNSESIDDTAEDELYQSGVQATSTCSWSLEGINSGIYRIRLLWAETQDNARGSRRFNVTVNGNTIASNLDVFDRVGAADTAYELTREVAVLGTNISISFSRVSGDPFINAMEVRRLLEITRGDSLPDTCAVSELFWLTTALDGQNLYGCTATDTWTQMTGSATVGTDEIGTDELDDGSDTPLAGEWVQVDASDTTQFRYRTDAEALGDLGATIVLESDIGSGLEVVSETVHTKSDEAEFLEDVAALSCGAGTKGQLAVVDGDVVLNYCDDAGTPAQHYVALGASDGDALAGDSATAFFDTGTVEAARLPNLESLNGTLSPGQFSALCTGGSGSDDYTCSLTPSLTAYADGMVIALDPDISNTGAATLNIDSLGAKQIYEVDDGVDPDDNDLLAGVTSLLTFCSSCNSSAGAWILNGITGFANNTDMSSQLATKQTAVDTIDTITFGSGTQSTFSLNFDITGTDIGCTIESDKINCVNHILEVKQLNVGDGTTAGILKVNELSTNGSEYRAWRAPDALAATVEFRFPDASPTAGQIMTFGAPSANVSEISFADPVTASSTTTFTEKTYDAESSGNTLTITSKTYLELASCQDTTAALMWDHQGSGFPAANCFGSNNNKGVADFDDTSDEAVHRYIALPGDFTGAVDVRLFAFAAATTGTARVGVRIDCVANSEAHDIADSNSTTFDFTPDGTTTDLVITSQTGVTTTGCAAGELAKIDFFRDADGTSGTDDMTGDLRVIGLEVTIRRAI